MAGIVCGLLAACGSKHSENDAAGESTAEANPVMHQMRTVDQVYEVTYQPGTIVVDSAAMQYLLGPVADNNRLEFSVDARPYLDLREGAVTIFPMTALGRVASWDEMPDRIIVHMTSVALTDAIRDARIHSEVQIDWQELSVRRDASESGFRFSMLPVAHAADDEGIKVTRSLTYSWKTDDGLKIDYTLKPESLNELGFEITASMSKEMYKKSMTPDQFKRLFPTRYANESALHPGRAPDAEEPDEGTGDREEGYPGGATAKVGAGIKGFAKASGKISGFSQFIDLEISDGELRDVTLDFKSLTGEIKLEAATLEGLVNTMNLSIPIEYKFVVLIGGILPLEFTLGADFSFRPIVERGTGGSSKICFVLAYDGSTGLQWADGTFSNQSTVTRRDVATCPDSETVSAGRLTVATGATINFPKFKVNIFKLPVATAIYVSSDGVTKFEPGIASAMPACQAGHVEIKAVVEATLEAFKVYSAKIQAMLWQYKREYTCGGKIVDTTFDKAKGKQETVSER